MGIFSKLSFLLEPVNGLPVIFWIAIGLFIIAGAVVVWLDQKKQNARSKDQAEGNKDQEKPNKPKKKFKFKLKAWMIYVLIILVVLPAAGTAYLYFGQPEVAVGILGAVALAGLVVYLVRRKKKLTKSKSSKPMSSRTKAAIALAVVIAAFVLLSRTDRPAQTLEGFLSSGKVSAISVSYTVDFNPRDPWWTKYELYIPAGSVVIFAAFGKVLCDRKVGWTGPEGADWAPFDLPKNAHLNQFLVGNIPMFSLVGRVGGMTFSIGTWLRQEFVKGGLLLLTLNERWLSKSFRDNRGSLTVKITIEPLGRRQTVISAIQFQEDPEYYWDVNGNHQPDSADLSFLIEALQDPSVFPGGLVWYGDVNGDETFNPADIVYFRRFMNGQGPPPVKAMWLVPAQ